LPEFLASDRHLEHIRQIRNDGFVVYNTPNMIPTYVIAVKILKNKCYVDDIEFTIFQPHPFTSPKIKNGVE